MAITFICFNFYSSGYSYTTNTVYLTAVVVSKVLVLPFAIVIGKSSRAQTGTSNHNKVLNSLDGVGNKVFEERAQNALLKRGQVLSDLAVHLVVLLPQLKVTARIKISRFVA